MKACIIGSVWAGLFGLPAHGQTPNHTSFEVASVKPASVNSNMIMCTGGPGTADPGIWRCTNVSVGFLIFKAFGYLPYQFDPAARCCQNRVDVVATVPAKTTKEQFLILQQNLLRERFDFRTHLDSKEMPIFELSVDKTGVKMKRARNIPSPEQDPWSPPRFQAGKDGYPEFLPGQTGVANLYGKYRWVGMNLSIGDIVTTLSTYVNGPIVDKTGLTARYNVDIKWNFDTPTLLNVTPGQDRDSEPDRGIRANESSAGPTLLRALQDGLGLKLNPKKGKGQIVIVDHIKKAPIPN